MARTTAPRRTDVLRFFAATYALSWLIWLPAVLWRGEHPNLFLVMLGACVPSAMGILFTYLTQDREGRRDFWTRVIDVRRIGWRWLLVIILVFPLANRIAMLVYALLGGTPPSPADVRSILADPGLMLQIILANLIISGFSEELGWRGYALDPLQRRWGALGASLVLGLAHAVWYVPLFLIPGITQGEMGLLTPGAPVFAIGTVAGSVVFTWVYNNTGRSILSAILLRFALNLCLDLLVGVQGAPATAYSAVYTGILVLLDLRIVAAWQARKAERRALAGYPA
jgi:membrane protease YdiL (CAAX protease family)